LLWIGEQKRHLIREGNKGFAHAEGFSLGLITGIFKSAPSRGWKREDS